jgi:hypothetical protein
MKLTDSFVERAEDAWHRAGLNLMPDWIATEKRTQ